MHETSGREQWTEARLRLLAVEKALIRQADAVARQRQELPWVRVEKDYRFATEQGDMALKDLFQGRTQLMVYHFMFGESFDSGCVSCSSIADGFNGIAPHLAGHDVMLWAVSKAPLGRLLTYRGRMNWSFPWASSHGNDFNRDFGVWFSEDEQRNGQIVYNYSPDPAGPWREGKEGGGHEAERFFAEASGTDVASYLRDRPGLSTFALQEGEVYHAYSTYARGVDPIWAIYSWLDRAPLGRNETGPWMRRRTDYAEG
ncbi:hypothetical protein TomMM35A_17680 [Sphingobium sp. TomMM35A]